MQLNKKGNHLGTLRVNFVLVTWSALVILVGNHEQRTSTLATVVVSLVHDKPYRREGFQWLSFPNFQSIATLVQQKARMVKSWFTAVCCLAVGLVAHESTPFVAADQWDAQTDVIIESMNEDQLVGQMFKFTS